MRLMAGRVKRLEVQMGMQAQGRRRCRVCEDGDKVSGLVFRIAGVESHQPLPICPGCGSCSAMIFDIIAVTEAPRAA
jgi:hypothetical protein